MSNSTLASLAMQEKTRREILHKGDLIPPLPDFVVRLLSLLNKPETEPQDLERQMQNDQVLVAKMLAMVNSPFYGLNRSIRTIKDAVMVLGFRGVRSLVLATSTAKFLQRDYACYGHEPKGLWLHAACVAAGAKSLARSCGLSADAAEQLFVAGLLHDIGKLLLVGYLNDALRSRPTGSGSSVELENRFIGIDHTEAGALVAAKWNLSPEIQDVIKAHHDRGTGEDARSVAVVRLVDALAHRRGNGYLPGRAPASVFQAEDLQVLGIDNDRWRQLEAGIEATMDDALSALAAMGS